MNTPRIIRTLRPGGTFAVSIATFAVMAGACGVSESRTGSSLEDAGADSGSNGSGSSGTSASSGSGTGNSSGVASSSGSGTGSSGGTSSASGSGTGSSSGGGTASSGTGGSSGVTGDGGTGGPQSVLQRGHDLLRHATFAQPGLTFASAPMMAPDTTFNANAVYPQIAQGQLQNQGTASVLYIEQGPAAAGCPAGAKGCAATTRPAGNGLFFAFTSLGSTPNVLAFDETSGQLVWTAELSGGDGIRGTPVIDPGSRRLFIPAGGNPHMVHALSVENGVEQTTGGWPVTLSATTLSYAGNGTTTTFNSVDQNQHGASLMTDDGILYIPFGGHYCDCNVYYGWIVAVDTTTTPPKVAGWATQSAHSGIWGAGGPASDGNGSIFAATGNNATMVPRAMSDSEEVVRLTGMAQFMRSAANVFVPTEALNWDQFDYDYGASTPAYVPLPAGSTPPALLVSPAKSGRLFILDGTNLSSGVYDANRTPGGALADIAVSGTGETVYTAPTIYTSASGLHATINVGEGGPNCPQGPVTTKEVIVSTLITPGQTPIGKIAWCTANSAGGGHINYPPISTTSDGVSANPIVWFVEGTQLTALNGDTGAHLVTTTGAACTGVPSMSFPIAVKNRIVVFAMDHLCSWSVGGK